MVGGYLALGGELNREWTDSVNNFATGSTERDWRSSQALRGKRETEATHRGQPTRTSLTSVYWSLFNRFGHRKVQNQKGSNERVRNQKGSNERVRN
jgi:hypothetical protein